MPLYCALQYHYSLDFSEFIAHPFAGLRSNDSSYRGHSVSPLVASLTVFACVFGGVLVGMWLRSTLPKDHLDAESRDTVKVGIGLIATMTALVLGLVTAAAKSSFDSGSAAVKQAAMNILAVDRALARYGPETGEIREGMKDLLAARIDAIWSHGSIPYQSTPTSPLGSFATTLLPGQDKLGPSGPVSILSRFVVSCGFRLSEVGLCEFRKPQVKGQHGCPI